MNDDFVHHVRTTTGEKHGRRAQSARELRPAALGLRDVVRVGAVGLRTRPMRAFLSALGIAIGIAAMVAVVGISSSSNLACSDHCPAPEAIMTGIVATDTASRRRTTRPMAVSAMAGPDR